MLNDAQRTEVEGLKAKSTTTQDEEDARRRTRGRDARRRGKGGLRRRGRRPWWCAGWHGQVLLPVE